MSNWFDEDNKQKQEPLVTPPPSDFSSGETASASSDTSADAPASTPADVPADTQTDTTAASGGWQRTDAPVEEPAKEPSPAVEPVQQTPPYSWGNTYATPPQAQSNPYQAPGGQQTPPGNYNPYGWNSQTPPPSKPPKKKRNKSNVVIATLAVVCGAVIITLSVMLALAVNRNNGGNLPTASSGSTTSQTENPNAPTLDYSDTDVVDGGLTTKEIIEKNLDSTVVITMYEQVQNNGFGNFGFGGSDGNTIQETGGATGIIMTADGYIITNCHCVINEDTNQPYARIDVTTYDGTVYEDAEIIGADQDTDLAVIKITAANLSVAEFGDSSKLSMGDRVVALGNAGGLRWSASQGIVSGLARDVYEDTGYSIKCLQTDAAINPGNSGGPLINNQGQVIGVNSVKIAASGYEGLGFSIPIKEAKTIIDDLVKYGKVKGRVMLGITGSEVTTPGYEGFMIHSIEEGSVLEGTNAQAGDIITHVNGTRVESYTAMRTELTKYQVGEQITLTLMRVDSRTGQTVSFNVECVLAES